MNMHGHNEATVRKSAGFIEEASANIADGWIQFGEAMCEAADLLGSKQEFDRWFKSQKFVKEGRPIATQERNASMWGAQNQKTFREGFVLRRLTTPQAAMKFALRAARDDQRDFVYVMENPSMPGMVKIGITKISPQERAKQISQNSGVPTPFAVVAEFMSMDVEQVERRAHELLRDTRVSANREFFAISSRGAISAISAAIKEVSEQ